MPVSFTLPLVENRSVSVKDMVFTILMTEYPLSLIQLLNSIKKHYARSVSFQSVRKAVLQLVEEKVLVRDNKKFLINSSYILSVVKFGSMLKKNYFGKSSAIPKVDIGQNIAVYTFFNLLDLDSVWNDLIRDHFASEKPPKRITFEAVHFWFVLVTLAQETELMKDLIKNKVNLNYLCYGNTLLDKWAVNHYNNIGVACKTLSREKDFVPGHNIGVYGNLIMHTTHPNSITKKMNAFFKKYKRIEDVKLSEITDIVKEKVEIKLTVINDPLLAKTVSDNVVRKFKGK